MVEVRRTETMAKKKADPKDAITKCTVRVDPQDGFERTALIIQNAETGSVDVVDKDGNRLCQINISFRPAQGEDGEWLNVDVIDVDDRYESRRALSFAANARAKMDVPKGGNLVATEFQNRKAKK